MLTVPGGFLMARKSYSFVVRARMALLAVPALCAVLGGLSGCDKSTEEAERRYCDQSGCFACRGDRCYPVAGDPVKPTPPDVSSCDNDAACGADKLCNLGKCEAACKDNSACKSGYSCLSGRCRPSDAASCGIARALCSDDTQCGTNQKCVNRTCALSCASGKCPTGQVCDSGACVDDPAPKSPECSFDADCGGGKGGFRCINAYCLATCSATTDCASGGTCFKGVCRGGR